MKKDATFKWDDKDFVNFYTDSANFIVLERQRSIRILLEIVAFHFPSLSGLHILDLGCGEGIITKYIYDKSPDNNFYLLDASDSSFSTAAVSDSTGRSVSSFQMIGFACSWAWMAVRTRPGYCFCLPCGGSTWMRRY